MNTQAISTLLPSTSVLILLDHHIHRMGSPSQQISINPSVDKNEAHFVENVAMKEEGQVADDVVATYNSYSPEFSAQVEKKLLRRIDLRIMPLVVIIYIFSYLDRNSVSRTTIPTQQRS